MPISAKLLMGVGGSRTSNSSDALQEIRKLLARSGCSASDNQIASYLKSSGKEPNDVIAMSELECKSWFNRCLNGVYNERPSSWIVN